MQLPGEGFTEISYVNQLLPQGLWMGLINEQLGYKDGIEISVAICQKAFALKTTEKHVNFSLVSNFAILTDDQKYALLEDLDKSSTLDTYRALLAPLICLFQEFPLSFLGKSDHSPEQSDLISTLRSSVERHADKYEMSGMALQSNMIYVRGVTGGLSMAKTMKAPDLNAIFEEPDSEAGKRAASFVRASVLMEYMPVQNVDLDGWSRSFWNHSYTLDKCDFSWESNDND